MPSGDNGERQVPLKTGPAHPKGGGKSTAGEISLVYGKNLDLTFW